MNTCLPNNSSATERATLVGFEHRDAVLEDVRLHYVIGGDGPPLLLWHGFCETWYCWRKVMPALAKRYTVIAPDMRGYGDSEKPEHGYDGLTLARDALGLLEHLDASRAFVAAHDMGAPAALLLAAEHPGAVRALAYLEEPVLTSSVMQQIHAFTPATTRNGLLWWWKLAFAGDFAEQLVAERERTFLDWFYRNGTVDRASIEDAAMDEYLRSFAASGGIRGAFGVYRDIFDTIAQTDALLTPERRLTVPVLGLGGVRSKGDQVRTQLTEVATHVEGGAVDDCGHFLPDERPDVLIKQLPAFFQRCAV